MGANAVPQSMQASHPALQWVRIFTVPPFFFIDISSISGNPKSPILLQQSISNCFISLAFSNATFCNSAIDFLFLSAEYISSTAHERFTAVGRAVFIFEQSWAR